MEVLLHAGRQSSGWRSRQMHQAVLSACGLTADVYTLGQLRYDWRKMKPTDSSNASTTATRGEGRRAGRRPPSLDPERTAQAGAEEALV